MKRKGVGGCVRRSWQGENVTASPKVKKRVSGRNEIDRRYEGGTEEKRHSPFGRG